MNIHRLWIPVYVLTLVSTLTTAVPFIAVRAGGIEARTPGDLETTRPWTPVGASSPLLFVENNGQFDERVRFQLRTGHEIWWFTDEGVWLTVVRATEGTQGDQETRGTQGTEGVNLHLTFPGMSPAARWAPVDPQPARMNYLQGNDASRWHADVPVFGGLRWENLYAGMSVTVRRVGQELAFTVEAPDGADLSAIQLTVEGAETVHSTLEGHPVADTALGPIILPLWRTGSGLSLQLIGSGNSLHLSASRASASSDASRCNEVTLSPCDPTNNPADLLYSTFLGGSGDDSGSGIAVDGDGAAYLTGRTASVDFPTTPGAFDLTCGTDGQCNPDPVFGQPLFDVYVSKLSADGSSLLWSTYLGGSISDIGFAIALGPDGGVYVTGQTSSSDFPTTPDAFDTSYNGGDTFGEDAFVTKLNATGSALVYSTYLGGRSIDAGNFMAVDANGTAYVAGQTNSPNFPTTPGAFDRTFNGGVFFVGDAFVARLNPTGSRLVYSTFLGGSASDDAHSIAIGTDGSVTIGGGTISSDFPTTPGAYDTTFNGGNENAGDSFVARLDPMGSTLVWSTFLGGSSGDGEAAIALGPDGAVYAAGDTTSGDFPVTPGAFDTTYNGGDILGDGYVTKLTPDGSAVLYSTFLGGARDDQIARLLVGAEGNAYVAGSTESYDFPVTPGAFDTSYNGSGLLCCPVPTDDVFVTTLNASGSALQYSTYLGGSDSDYSIGMAVGVDGTVYTTGYSLSSNFPATSGAFDTICGCAQFIGDAFVSKLNVTEQTLHVATIEPGYRPLGRQYRVHGFVVIQDANHVPVSDAQVRLDLTLPFGRVIQATRITNAQGLATVRFTTPYTGTYTFAVLGVRKLGYTYDSSQNEETSDSVTVP